MNRSMIRAKSFPAKWFVNFNIDYCKCRWYL